MTTNIDAEAFKEAGLSFEEIESVKKGLEDIDNGKTISHKNVKIIARREIFSDSKIHA